MPEPFPVPVGLRLNQAARAVGRAFDETLAAAGGSLPVWLILLNLKVRRPGTQRELAEAVGIREATLTHHLNAMDADGLVTRTRDAANRRIQLVTLTAEATRRSWGCGPPPTAFDARLNAGPPRPIRPPWPHCSPASPRTSAPPPRPGPARPKPQARSSGSRRIILVRPH